MIVRWIHLTLLVFFVFFVVNSELLQINPETVAVLLEPQ